MPPFGGASPSRHLSFVFLFLFLTPPPSSSPPAQVQGHRGKASGGRPLPARPPPIVNVLLEGPQQSTNAGIFFVAHHLNSAGCAVPLLNCVPWLTEEFRSAQTRCSSCCHFSAQTPASEAPTVGQGSHRWWSCSSRSEEVKGRVICRSVRNIPGPWHEVRANPQKVTLHHLTTTSLRYQNMSH